VLAIALPRTLSIWLFKTVFSAGAPTVMDYTRLPPIAISLAAVSHAETVVVSNETASTIFLLHAIPIRATPERFA
jgi:hypothetical protein